MPAARAMGVTQGRGAQHGGVPGPRRCRRCRCPGGRAESRGAAGRLPRNRSCPAAPGGGGRGPSRAARGGERRREAPWPRGRRYLRPCPDTATRAPTPPPPSRRPRGAAQPRPPPGAGVRGTAAEPGRAGGSGESPAGGARSGGNLAGRDGRRQRPLAGLPAPSGASSARPPGRAASPWQSHIPAAGGGRRRSGEERSPACRCSRAAGSARLGGEELPRAPAADERRRLSAGREGGPRLSRRSRRCLKGRRQRLRGSEAGLRRRGEPRPPRAPGAVPVPIPAPGPRGAPGADSHPWAPLVSARKCSGRCLGTIMEKWVNK